MELGQTFSYIFEDKDWLKKLIPLAGLGLLSMIPVLGLLPLSFEQVARLYEKIFLDAVVQKA